MPVIHGNAFGHVSCVRAVSPDPPIGFRFPFLYQEGGRNEVRTLLQLEDARRCHPRIGAIDNQPPIRFAWVDFHLIGIRRGVCSREGLWHGQHLSLGKRHHRAGPLYELQLNHSQTEG